MTDLAAMSKESSTIVVSPVGEIAPWITSILAEKVKDFFGFNTKVTPLLADIAFAYDPERNQYHSTLILEKLARGCPGDGLKVLGVTKEDLFIPILTHVYGEAQLGGVACIISISRLITGPDMGGGQTAVPAGLSRKPSTSWGTALTCVIYLQVAQS